MAGAMAGAMAGGSIPTPDLAGTMARSILRGVREQVISLTALESRLDSLRPCFDVESDEVKARLRCSFHPGHGRKLLLQVDLYAPTKITLTLAALVLSGLKRASALSAADGSLAAPPVADGATLVGTALAIRRS